MRKMSSDVILEVDRLSVSFRMYEKGLEQKILRVINHLSLRVNAGEILAVAGSSGSGKSLLAHAILGSFPPMPASPVRSDIAARISRRNDSNSSGVRRSPWSPSRWTISIR